ncbi:MULTISPECIES: hypothetical protein [Pseudonocardia]|uniref:hypothetical protein n=1 Tax=Pseudonocardia TaxID=1847 RepID=UPI001AD6A735|nr:MULTISPECIES: hypothetical protein [Pseudonocardia]MBO4239194.1 hypothetical protein [Pseudonocardia alni]
MWVFLSRRIRIWLLFAVGVPLLSRLLGALGAAVERRRGPSTVTRLLTAARRWLDRRARGPWGRDRRAGTDHRHSASMHTS